MENEIAIIETGKTARGKKAWKKLESEYVRLRQAGESIQDLSDSFFRLRQERQKRLNS
jgi:hypothetical protein